MNSLLNIFIPTYNRPAQIIETLSSLEDCMAELSIENRSLVSITIHNNSTSYFSEYSAIYVDFKEKFERLGFNKIKYTYTGLDIGSYQNIVGGLLSSMTFSEYIWILPDDDLARYDSLKVLLPILSEYQPCFVSGAGVQKTTFSYLGTSFSDNDKDLNKIYKIMYSLSEKIDYFLDDNIVQAQEYVYKTSQISGFFKSMQFNNFANEMFPGTLALYSLRSDLPYISLERSIGIFRDDDPRSQWRHKWFKYALIVWPKISKEFFDIGFLQQDQFVKSKDIYRGVFEAIKHRPDVLSGMNKRYELSPFQLYKFHGHFYLRYLLSSIYLFCFKVVYLMRSKLK